MKNTSEVFTGIAELQTWLAAQPANTPETPYAVALNVDSLGGGSLAPALGDNPWEARYISLDLSGSALDGIGDDTFFDCLGLVNVTMPEGVTRVGDRAFYGCGGLTAISIPKSVAAIGKEAFADCYALAAIEVEPDNAAYSSADGVLYNKAKTALIRYPAKKADAVFTVPDGVTAIGDGAFSGCETLAAVAFPDGVTSIGEDAFTACMGLESVALPGSLTAIGKGAFRYCHSLAAVTIPKGVTAVSEGAFSTCDSLAVVIIPEGVVSIGKEAFFGCRSLASLSIPSSLTSIGNGAFTLCDSLAAVAFPSGLTRIGDGAFAWCGSLAGAAIPASVVNIGQDAFSCSGLSAIEVDPANAGYSSADGVLYDKTKSTLLRYPAGKPGSAFTVPDSVTRIGDGAFAGSVLAVVTVPKGVAQIGDGAFTWCPALTAIEVDSANAAYCSCGGVLYNKAKTILIQYPRGKADAAFAIPPGVVRVWHKAFYEAYNLTAVTIPDGVTRIGEGAFAHCDLRSVTIPAGVTHIGEGAFSWCLRFRSVTFLGPIPQAGFPPGAFPGEVRDQFYKTDPENGTPGTYTN